MDITSISSALSSIKTATELTKYIKDSSQSLEQADTKLKLAELTSALADAKMEIADVQQVIQDKDKEISLLKDKLCIKENVEYREPAYWVVDETKEDGPFCQQCYDNEGKLIRLQSVSEKYLKCKTCGNGFPMPGFVARARIITGGLTRP